MDTNRRYGRLQRLIQASLDAGSSLRDIEKRATSAGHRLSYSQVHAYSQGIAAKAPSREQIEALAAALPASEVEVRRAVFIDWYGYDPIENAADHYLIAVPADLPDDRKREIDQMVQAWLAINAKKR